MNQKKYKNISVIIPVYNGESNIKKCLDAIIDQDYPSKYVEIIIIDNGSTDNTKEILNNYKNQIKIIDCKKRGPSAARNKGIKIASGELLLLIDSDCIASKNLISKHVEAHIYFSKNDPNVKVIGGGIEGINKNFWSVCDDFCCWYKQHPGNNEKYICEHPTANLSFSKEIIKDTGLFDEELHYAEDYAFCVKINKCGYKIYFKPKAKIYHINRTSLKHFINHVINWGKTQYLLREKGVINSNRNKSIFKILLFYIFYPNYILLNILIHAFKVKRFYIILFFPFVMLNKYLLYFFEVKDEIKYFLDKKGCSL